MSILKNKIDFAVVFSVKNANPNGDPLNGNLPRETYDGLGEVSDVCIKRKIRNRLQDMGEKIFVQMEVRSDDGFDSLSSRASNNEKLKQCSKDRAKFIDVACEQWIDVRAFGQVFAFNGVKNVVPGDSVGIRGPVSIHPAISHEAVEIESMQITKSVNSTPGEKKGSDTMGSKHRISFGLYSFCGSINCQLAEKTGFTDEDSEKLLQALKTLFDNDASSARPEGSMEVCRVFWWRHNCSIGQYSSAKVHRSLRIESKCDNPKSFEDYNVIIDELPGLLVKQYDLF